MTEGIQEPLTARDVYEKFIKQYALYKEVQKKEKGLNSTSADVREDSREYALEKIASKRPALEEINEEEVSRGNIVDSGDSIDGLYRTAKKREGTRARKQFKRRLDDILNETPTIGLAETVLAGIPATQVPGGEYDSVYLHHHSYQELTKLLDGVKNATPRDHKELLAKIKPFVLERTLAQDLEDEDLCDEPEITAETIKVTNRILGKSFLLCESGAKNLRAMYEAGFGKLLPAPEDKARYARAVIRALTEPNIGAAMDSVLNAEIADKLLREAEHSR